jgi:hypothetical protein
LKQKKTPKNWRNNMFRRLIITALATTGIFAGLALTPNAAEAHEYWHGHYRYYPPVRVITPCFDVYCGGPGCWDLRRTFYSRVEADRFAADLRCHGVRVDIRCR